MTEPYKDPWADAANQAVGGLFKAILSRPNPAQLQEQQLRNQMVQSQLRNSDLAYQTGQFDLNKAQNEASVADKFSQALNQVPTVGKELPLAPAQYGPNPAATVMDRNENIANVFEQYAPKLSKDTVDATRGALGTAGALRFEDPIQRQLALDERASSYDSLMPGYTLSPGQIRFGADNEMIQSAPFKQGGGSYIQQPDGTVISIDGGGPGFGTSANNDLDKQSITIDGALRSIAETKAAIQGEEGQLWKSTGIPGAVAGTEILGVMQQLPMFDQGFEQVQLGTDDLSRIKVNRARLEQTINEVGRFIVNGPYSDRFSNDDRKAANDAIQITKMGTNDTSAIAILDGLETTLRNRLQGVSDLKTQGMSSLGGNTSNLVITPQDIDNMTEQELDAFLSEQ